MIFEGTRAEKTEAFYRHVEAVHSAVKKPLKDLGKGKGKATTEERKRTCIGTSSGDTTEPDSTVASGQQAIWDLTMQPAREKSTETDPTRQDRGNDPPSPDNESSVPGSPAGWTDFRLADAMYKGKERATSTSGISTDSMQPSLIYGPSFKEDAPPSLHGSSSSLTESEASIDTALVENFSEPVRLLDDNGVLVQLLRYECVFWFLSCPYVSQDRSDWDIHCLSHFRGNAPPQSVQCPLCDWGASSDDNASAWNARMDHFVVTHFSVGETLLNSRADIPLFTHLWQQRLIGDRDFQELRGLCWSS